ncbi:MAG: cell division protein FtsA [Alkaliphilus sp.]
MDREKSNNELLTFALDIGTRSVVGILGSLDEEVIKIHYSDMEFQTKRAMYDGQIHDIEGVVEIVKKVKKSLEDKAGIKLKKVAIAAAGRALKTSRLTIERELDESEAIDKHFVRSIEIEGLQEAQMKLEENALDASQYFCVGHTVVNYYLNDILIKNPTGHKAKKISVDILATFLPYAVVDSLYSVMKKVGLEVSFMTLEPIAAISVAVPQNVRLLNIALVDIGAGTSDIAITRDGSVTAYDMASTAGDEITESLVQNFLLDFDSAEIVKCNLHKNEEQSFQDILGMQHKYDSEPILEKIRPAIELVVKDIADRIIVQNGKAPSAIFLIGGGSQIPSLPELLANRLGLPKERVAVRGIETIKGLEHEELVVSGPEGITPVGILAKTLEYHDIDFIETTVNGRGIKLFQSKQLKVSDALVLAEFNPRDLIQKKGASLNLIINGKKTMYFGEYGEAAKIHVNNKEAHLDTAIADGGTIKIEPAKAGCDARRCLNDIIDFTKGFYVDGRWINRIQNINVNGRRENTSRNLDNNDNVQFHEISAIFDLCNFMKIDFDKHSILMENKKTGKSTKIIDNIYISIEAKALKAKSTNKERNSENKENEDCIYVIYNGSPLRIVKDKEQLIFVDIFNSIDFDRSKVNGKLVLTHNGQPANYTSPLKDKDIIVIEWAK